MTTQSKFNRAIAVFILLNFSFAQVLPSGLALEQVYTPQQETQTLTTTLEESMNKEETTDSENPPASEYEQFLDPSPISSTDVPEVKAEDVRVETVPVDGIKKYAFDTFDQISQRDHFTIQDLEALRGAQSALKKSIEDLPEDERKPWIDAFNEFLRKSDQILSSKPLKVVLEDGTELLVRNPTDIMMKIIQRFKMMDQNGEIKLERLAGIDIEDLEGLETLSGYMSNRQIGAGFSIPLFDLFSPNAAPVLIDRLVRKFANAEITIAEGPAEVITDEILRFVDGTKPTFDAALQIASEVFARHQVEMPVSPFNMGSLMRAIEDMAALHDDLIREIKAILDAYRGESVFKNLLVSQISQELMHGSREPAYGPLLQQFNTLLYNSDVTYEIDGTAVQVSRVDLDIFTNNLPYDSQTLYRYPGVNASVERSFLAGLVSQELMSRISYLDFNGTENLTPSASEVQYFSTVARRFQLLEVFLKTWPDVLTDGKVNFDKLRFHLLVSYELEMELGRAQEYINNQIQLMNSYSKNVLSEADYLAMKELLRSSNEELVKRFMPLLQNVIYDTSNEVTSRVQLRFNELVNSFSGVLSQVSAMVVIVDGQEIKVDLKKIKESILDVILNATSIAQNGQFDNSAYLRMNGIDAAMMSSLMTREEMGSLRQIRFYNYASSWRSSFAAGEEILFNLIPQLVKKIGTANDADLMQKLTENIDLPVSLGENLRAVINQKVTSLSQGVLNQMNTVSIKSISDLLGLRDLFVNYHYDLSVAMTNLTKNLSVAEKAVLQSEINSYWGQVVPNFGTVTQYFRNAIRAVDMLDVAGVRISLRAIASIAGFPASKDFDHELFSGLMDDDFAGAETSDEYSKHSYFYFQSQPNFQPAKSLSVLGRIQMIVRAVERVLGNSDLPSNMVFVDSVGVKTLNTEIFRKYVKGVLRMQQETIAEAEKRALAMAEELKVMKKGVYTIEEIEAMHQKVLKFRQNLIDLLNEKASRHERGDVIQTENQISLIHQQYVFNLFKSMVSEAKLVLAVQGQLVEIPAKVITESLIATLTEKLDGKNPAAHDFAMFYGISVDVLRRIHKLENYMGEQMVIMPRNSEYVQIVSQISELGYMQLAVYLVSRYAEEVIKDGQVDVTRLLELASDKEGAISKVSNEAAAILDQKLKELGNFDRPLSLEDLRKVGALVDDAKLAWVTMMNDFLSGLNDSEAKERLENFINELNLKLAAARDELLARNPIEIEIDGQKVQIRITDEMLTRFRIETEKYAAEALQQEVFGNVLIPQIDYAPLKLTVYAESQLMVEDYSVQPLSIAIPPRLIWNPLPRYNSKHHITDSGLHTLMARLISKFGEFVVVPNADGELTVDMGLFIKELYLSDENRSERRLQRILENDIPAMEEAVAAMRDADGAFRIENVDKLNALFLQIKERIVKALPQGYSQKAAEAGQKLAAIYTGAILGPLSLEINGRRISYNAKTLSEMVDRLKQNKQFDSEFLKQFSEMLKTGETSWVFSDFLNIPQNYYYRYYQPIFMDQGGFASDESQTEEFDGITLGQLDRFIGISGADLTGLDVKEKNALRLSPLDPLTLMGLLDMRTLAPGSGVSTGGLMNTAMASSAMSVSAERLSVISGGLVKVVEDWIVAPVDYIPLPIDETTNLYNLMWQKSSRFIALELIPAFIKALGVDLVVFEDGKINLELFEQGLKGELIDYSKGIDLNGKKVSVDMRALVDQIKAARAEATRKQIEETGQHPIEGYGMESLLFLKGVKELFTVDEIMSFLTPRQPYCFSNTCTFAITIAPPQYSDSDWGRFMTELLRRMDAKGQEILAPINYLVDPGPDAPMFSVMNEKVIELVKNGLEDPSAKKWDIVRNTLSEIESQLEKLKALKTEMDAMNQKAGILQREHDELNQILVGERSLMLMGVPEMMVYWPHLVLIDELTKYQTSLKSALEAGDLEKALSFVIDYEAMKNNPNDLAPDFDAAVEEILKLTAQAQERLKELPGLIQQLKDKIAARSREWEKQALAQFQKYGDIIKSVVMRSEKIDRWEPKHVVPATTATQSEVLAVNDGERWVERRYFTITFADGTVIEGSGSAQDPFLSASENGNIHMNTIHLLDQKRKELSQPKPSTPPLVKSLPPSPAAVGFFAPVFRAPLAKVFAGAVKTASKIFKSPLAAFSR